MFRRFAMLIVLLLAFWQVGVIAGQPISFTQPEESAHALMHWVGEPHHHHDGDVSEDDSDESIQHVASDGCAGGSAIWPAGLVVSSSPSIPSRVAETDQTALPGPALDGPMRPPRLTI
jgi:hypothetical protein